MRTTKTAKTVTTAFDVARYLRTPKERAEYLNARLEDAPEDVAGYASALGDVARAHGMAKVASDTGLSRESLYKALSQRGNPSLATVLKVWWSARSERAHRSNPVGVEGEEAPRRDHERRTRTRLNAGPTPTRHGANRAGQDFQNPTYWSRE